MKQRIARVLMATALMVTLCSPLSAEGEKRFALVIGNQKYEESALRNPEADAMLVKRQLEDCGFTVRYYTNLNSANLRTKIGQYAQEVNATKKAVSFFYYSGHGVQIDGQNYLVPVDNGQITSEETVQSIGYSLDDLLKILKAPTQIVVLDACRNNPFRESGKKAAGIKGGLAAIKAKDTVSLSYLFATQAGQTADDGKGTNSLFTKTLVNEIAGSNDELTTIFNKVNQSVKLQTNGKQVPLNSGTGTNFYFYDAAFMDEQIKQIQAQMAASGAKPAAGSKTAAGAKAAGTAATAALASTGVDPALAVKQRQLELLQQRKAQAEEDKRRKAQADADSAQRTADQKKKLDELRKAAEAAAIKLQQQDDGVDPETAVDALEQKKAELQKVYVSLRADIKAYNDSKDKELSEKNKQIDANFKGEEWRDAKGNLTDSAKTSIGKQKADNGDAIAAAKKENSSKEWAAVQPQLAEIRRQGDVLSKRKFFATSVSGNALTVRIADYDATKRQWNLRITSSFFESSNLFSATIPLGYESITGLKLKAANQAMTKAESDEYSQTYSMYNSLFRSAVPVFRADLTFQIVEDPSNPSTYFFKPLACTIIRTDTNVKVAELGPGDLSAPTSFTRTPPVDIRTDDEILNATEKKNRQEINQQRTVEAKTAFASLQSPRWGVIGGFGLMPGNPVTDMNLNVAMYSGFGLGGGFFRNAFWGIGGDLSFKSGSEYTLADFYGLVGYNYRFTKMISPYVYTGIGGGSISVKDPTKSATSSTSSGSSSSSTSTSIATGLMLREALGVDFRFGNLFGMSAEYSMDYVTGEGFTDRYAILGGVYW